MNRAGPGTIAILWRGDRTTRREATPHNNRFHQIFEELASLGLRAEPAVYDETFADEVRAQLLRADGVLVWVNPLQDGKTRHCLDAMLREVASNGPWVSAHPDTILRMGTKEVLVRTRRLGWGTDTQLYESMAQLRDALTAQLAAGSARVLKQNRGNDGQGVWKVEPVASRGGSMVRIGGTGRAGRRGAAGSLSRAVRAVFRAGWNDHRSAFSGAARRRDDPVLHGGGPCRRV